MTKSSHKLAFIPDQRGQISIFFSSSLIVLISIVAFVINIGLFVKAKINLQNATDAAAFSGASVQARQLTKIAYLNWEMRNIYKEWMYKYYVVGNLNVADVESNFPLNTPGPMNFRLLPDIDPITHHPMIDQYNFPSVCIHVRPSVNSDGTNICKLYGIPGLPEFGAVNVAGTEEASRSFIDVLVAGKTDDCGKRTRLNMYVALSWAYNVNVTTATPGADTLAGRGPAILTDRQGAWPQAIELAIRMRNLERVVNSPPVKDGVCSSPGSGSGKVSCSTAVADHENNGLLGSERIVKAFYSGYRNLGNESDNEMKSTFKLSELSPTVYNNQRPNDASNLLIPKIYSKYYLDLKLMMVNYAVFYTAFIARSTSNVANVTNVSGACDVSKVALPVPGYPLGYYKNPDVLTYYAVKGEAEFVGMFNPFNDAIKLTAFSAAKPFGGRIGPALFTQKGQADEITARSGTLKKRSVPYISSIDLSNIKDKLTGNQIQANQFTAGMALPINFTTSPGFFWLKDENSPLGGMINNEEAMQFGIPNLPYDFKPGSWSSDAYQNQNFNIHTVKASETIPADEVGLFSKFQFARFRGPNVSGNVTPEELVEEISRVRAPTRYEAANYLIPTPGEFNLEEKIDSFSLFPNTNKSILPKTQVRQYHGRIYAPLYANNGQQDVLFADSSAVVKTIFDFMKVQRAGMKKYKIALNKAAIAIFNMTQSSVAAAAGTADAYQKAALNVSRINLTGDPMTQDPADCNSMAGEFLYFYYGSPDLVTELGSQTNTGGCPVPLGDLLLAYFANRQGIYDPTYYNFELNFDPKNFTEPVGPLGILSGYMPGPFNGVDSSGLYQNPLNPGATEMMRRNSYSTKFVTLDSLQEGHVGYANSSNNFPTYSEGGTTRLANPINGSQEDVINGLDSDAASEVNSIRY